MRTIHRLVRTVAVFWLVSGCSADTGPHAGDDLADRLAAIEGMVSVEELGTSAPGYTLYALVYEQPVDHNDPDSAVFAQHLTLLHRAVDAPLVVASTGYFNYLVDGRTEPTRLLDGNQVVIEHRYFAGSRPEPADWTHLNIAQAAADHHRVIQALSSIYTGPRVSTGASKGGATSIFHRRFYPGDVDATIAYVAPISLGFPDDRYLAFFDTVGNATGDAACRDNVRAFQRDALGRLDNLAQLADTYAQVRGYTFNRLGGAAPALEQGVIEFEWGFWQYLGRDACGAVPTAAATDAQVLNFLNLIESVDYMSDQLIDMFEPYFYQSATELGYPTVPVAHLADLLQYQSDFSADFSAFLPAGVAANHDPAAMLDMDAWVREQADALLLIYGEYDPWTGGAFDPGDNAGVHVFLAPAADHGATIADLDPGDRDQALGLIETWTGVDTTSASARLQTQYTWQPLPRSAWQPRLHAIGR